MRTLLSNPLFRLLAVNWLAGLAVTLLLVGGIYLTDPAGLWTLITRSQMPAVPIAMLFFGFLITFTSAAMGTAIMSMPRDERPGGGRRIRVDQGEPVPIPVRAETMHRRRR